MSLQDKVRAYLEEEEFRDRFDGEIRRIVREYKSSEFIEEYTNLLDKKNKTGSLKDNLEFYNFCSKKIVGNLVLHDLLDSNYSQITEFYLKEIAGTIKANDKIIDVGCATGLIPVGLAELIDNLHVVGADISEGLLMRARERAKRRDIKNIEFVRANIDDLYQQLSQEPLRSPPPYDYLICLDTINESLDTPSSYEKKVKRRLKEFERVLRNSGKLSIGMKYHFSKRDSYDCMQDFYERILGSVFSLENMLSREIRTKDGIIYTAYLFNVKVKS